MAMVQLAIDVRKANVKIRIKASRPTSTNDTTSARYSTLGETTRVSRQFVACNRNKEVRVTHAWSLPRKGTAIFSIVVYTAL